MIFELKSLQTSHLAPHSPRLSPSPSLSSQCAEIFWFISVFSSSLRFVRFRLALFVCLFICWLICSSSIIHNHMCLQQQSERERRKGERERGEGKHELLLVSSHCVKFLASTSFGILCQGHSTNSLDLTNIENICVFARHPTLPLPLPLFILSSLTTVRCNK